MQKEENNLNEEQRNLLKRSFQSVEEEITETKVEQCWNELVQTLNQPKQDVSIPHENTRIKLFYAKVVGVAAALIGIFFAISFFYNTNFHQGKHAIVQLEASIPDTLNQVMLITHANECIVAGEKADISYSRQGETFVNKRHIETKTSECEYNQLIVPCRKSSHLMLADGTQIYVNAGTKVIYPSVFDGKYREIYVNGEIFIDVKENPEHPFIVKTPKFDIRVTGTAFNVNAYKSMEEAEVVLLRGSICVKGSNGEETSVKPDELLKLSRGVAQDKCKVDATAYTAWMQGRFPLQGRTMQNIMQRLARYYGCEISFDKSVEKLSLQGTIDMSVPLDRILERIAKVYPIEITDTVGGYYLTINNNQ